MRIPSAKVIAPVVAVVLLSMHAGYSVVSAAQPISNSPHNLSVRRPDGVVNNYKSTQESRICIYCHTPHHAGSEGPLWSRELAADSTYYSPYRSATITVLPGQPTGSSRLCLSCHDGTIALGNPADVTGQYFRDTSLIAPITGKGSLGTDLTDDHPISMRYNDSGNSELYLASTLAGKGIKLEDSQVECVSCHDAHDNQFGKFLVVSNVKGFTLCIVCHNVNGWDVKSSHASADSVQSEGCRNCHKTHAAPGRENLLKSATGKDNCLTATCHTTGVGIQFQQPFLHNKSATTVEDRHTPNETLPFTPPGGESHVECVDCHNPHQAGSAGMSICSTAEICAPSSKGSLFAPAISDALRGVRGVDKFGASIPPAGQKFPTVTAEYEICFRCHSDGNASRFVTQPINRVRIDYNERFRFSTGSISRHPVTEDRVYLSGKVYDSLQLDPGIKRIYCVDCHNPHAADNQALLKRAYRDSGSGTQTGLCFSNCHKVSFVMSPSSGFTTAAMNPLHTAHHLKNIFCFVCHDPHGVSLAGGGTINANASLINFDKSMAGNSALFNKTARSCSNLITGCHASGSASY